jgi:hypothetical protein
MSCLDRTYYSDSGHYEFLGRKVADNFVGIFLIYRSKITLTCIVRRGVYDTDIFTCFSPVIRPLLSINRKGGEVLF